MRFRVSGADFRVQKKASYLHRTATTAYPCCVPALGDSAGAGRVGLARCKYTTFYAENFRHELLIFQ